MEDIKKIQEFFSKPLEEGKQLDQVDFAKVVQAVTKTGHPVTVLLVPKFNEIEVITGMNAPDDVLFDLSNAVDSLGYGSDDIIIAGDSSNLSRREYSDIRRVNGGAKDYFEESVNEQADHVSPMVAKAYREYLQAKKDGDGEKAYRYYSKKLNNTYSTRADRDAIEAILKKKYGSAMEESVNESQFKDLQIGDEFLRFGENGQLWKKTSNKQAEFIKNVGKKTAKYNKKPGSLDVFLPTMDITLYESVNEGPIEDIQKKLNALGVKYEMSKTDKVRPFKAIYKPINKSDEFYNKFENIVDLYNLGGVVKTSMNEGAEDIMDAYNDVLDLVKKHSRRLSDDDSYTFGLKLKAWFNKNILDEATKDEETEFHKKLDTLVHDTFGKRKGELEEAEYSKYAKLIDLVQKADNPKNLSIYYNSDFGVVNIGGVGYDKGDLVKMFRSQPGTSIDIKNIFFKANQNPEQTAKDVNSLNMGVKAEVDYGYGKEPFIKFTKGYSDEFLDQMTKDQMDHDKETLRRERGLEENKYNPDLDQDDEEVPMPMDDEGRPLGESNPDAELKVGDYQTKYFYICPGAKSLYQDIEDKVEDMGLAIRAAKLQDALFAIEAAALENGATESEVFAAQSIADQIMAMAAMMGLDKEHSYIQGHVDKIKGAVDKEQVDEGASSEEKRMAMQAIKRFAKYRGVSEKEAKADLIRAVKELGSIEEAINEIVETIQVGKVLEEKLCKKGEAYRKRRMAAGEKSSAYLSGRAVKVCKGQISGRKKRKNKK